MTNYNYRQAVKEDIENYIEENYNESDFEGMDKDDVYEKLNDELWITDSVTGNASGSYTFNSYKAEEYVKDNLPLCIEACTEFGLDSKQFGERIYNEDYEYLDVTIRCYLLSQCLGEVIDELEWFED